MHVFIIRYNKHTPSYTVSAYKRPLFINSSMSKVLGLLAHTSSVFFHQTHTAKENWTLACSTAAVATVAAAACLCLGIALGAACRYSVPCKSYAELKHKNWFHLSSESVQIKFLMNKWIHQNKQTVVVDSKKINCRKFIIHSSFCGSSGGLCSTKVRLGSHSDSLSRRRQSFFGCWVETLPFWNIVTGQVSSYWRLLMHFAHCLPLVHLLFCAGTCCVKFEGRSIALRLENGTVAPLLHSRFEASEFYLADLFWGNSIQNMPTDLWADPLCLQKHLRGTWNCGSCRCWSCPVAISGSMPPGSQWEIEKRQSIAGLQKFTHQE